MTKSAISVLIVDDEKAICTIVGQYLKKIGYEVYLSNSGEEAIEVLKSTPINIVLTDIKMPGISGVDLLKWIKEYRSDIPVLITTGFPTLDTAIEALKLGAYDYLTKPFHLEEIGEKVRRALDKKRLEEDNILFSRLVSLHDVTKALASTHEIEALCYKILDFSCSMVHASGASLMFLTETSQLTVSGIYGDSFNSDFWKNSSVFGVVPLKVATFGEPIIVSSDQPRQYRDIPPLPSQICSYIAFPLKTSQYILGVLNLVRTVGAKPFSRVDIEILNVLASQASITIENVRLYQSIRNNYLQTIRAFALAVEAKDRYTHGHSERVSSYSVLLAKHLKVEESEIENIKFAGLLHDIGKIGISELILNKPGKLTMNEFDEIKTHPLVGARILSDVPLLKRLVPLVLHHHEFFNGNGYPDGIQGENIPFGARILSVADTYEAMTSDRPYRKAMSKTDAIQILSQQKDKQFDPKIVDAFISIINNFEI